MYLSVMFFLYCTEMLCLCLEVGVGLVISDYKKYFLMLYYFPAYFG